tara:strand:- start:664 stop:1545 length:882 start_codon:yes stop_codon:yes gene_type:complete
MTIKNLVLSGGGPAGFSIYGAVSNLSKESYWNLKNIENIYGTSIGSFIGVVLLLDYEWDVLDDYFMKRPWNEVVNIEPVMFIEAYKSKGILDKNCIKECIKYLFTAKNLNEDITLKELFEFSNINLYLYTTEINNDIMEKVELSHHNYPNLSVITALSMSMAFPFIFQPICNNSKCYIDGGVLNNFPLNDCIKTHKCKEDETLSFKIKWILEDNKNIIYEESNIIDFLISLLQKMKNKIDTIEKQIEIKNTVISKIVYSNNFSIWSKALNEESFRKELINIGIEGAKLFLKNL